MTRLRRVDPRVFDWGLALVFAVWASISAFTPEDVTVITGDTAGVEHGTGSFASRAAVVGGSAVALAARDVRDKARLLASRALGCTEADLEQSGAAFTDRARPERRAFRSTRWSKWAGRWGLRSKRRP